MTTIRGVFFRNVTFWGAFFWKRPKAHAKDAKGEEVLADRHQVREEGFGASGTLQRETPGEVVLESRLRSALVKSNPWLPPEALAVAVDEPTRDRSAKSPAAANREVWQLLREGVKVSVADRERGGQKTERVRVLDWDKPFLQMEQGNV